jgi:hypothetical protein
MTAYADFLASKAATVKPLGFDVDAEWPHLFPFQRDLTRWALRQGRCAIFADTGLGKSRMQLTWADHVCKHVGGSVLILAPLAVAAQTVREGECMGVRVTLCRESSDVRSGINITNYDRLHKFDPSIFVGVVLDESSCIKHHEAKTLGLLISAFGHTQYKLCATATPAPNDFTELGTHAEFLGLCTRAEMLSEYFVHDSGSTQDWRLKGHARKAFWRWVASWGALVRRPSDLAYDDAGYNLPPLEVTRHVVPVDAETLTRMGLLFAEEARDLNERRDARRASIDKRVALCAELINRESSEQWIAWGNLNAETEGLTRAVPDAVEVRGPDDPDTKEQRLLDFAAGRIRVLCTKSSIAGWGLNLQGCSHMAFIGVDDSYEAYYQAVRRCYRFKQTRPVHVHIFASEAEGSVIENLRRKEADAQRMADELSAETRDAVRENVTRQLRHTTPYAPAHETTPPSWLTGEP